MIESNPGKAWARDVVRMSKRGPTEAEVGREVAKDAVRTKKIADKKARSK